MAEILLFETVFWISAGVVIYAYIGYPLVLILLRALFPNPVKQAPIEPFVSILVPAYNEGRFIAAKVENVLQLDYPADKLEVVIACDGCTDATVELARNAVSRLGADSRITIFDYPVNRGKISVLNDSVPRLKGEIVVFSDAAAMFAPDAIRKLMRNYADPHVGAVGGIYRVLRPDSANIGVQEDLYWKYETFLKVLESSLGSVLGLHGHIHSLRKELYPFPEIGTINDDYVIPVRVLQKDYRVVYEPEAAVYEEAQEMTGFGRRVRIMAGNFQQLSEIRDFLSPLRLRCLFYFISHKALRLAVPFAMLLALLFNAFLLDQPLYRTLFWLQAGFYLLAALGSAWKLKPKLLRLPYYFCMVNAAVFAGVYHALTGRRRMAWS
jgi:cellulose synthase/poly-beta-1,6-N-acetylglucosamine synthase-like glycosyltransferase